MVRAKRTSTKSHSCVNGVIWHLVSILKPSTPMLIREDIWRGRVKLRSNRVTSRASLLRRNLNVHHLQSSIQTVKNTTKTKREHMRHTATRTSVRHDSLKLRPLLHHKPIGMGGIRSINQQAERSRHITITVV